MSEPLELLRMEGVRKSFGATQALAGVDLRVCAGEVLALVGENGAGKSTLMKVLSGAHPPDAGRMWLAGNLYQPQNPLEARRAGVAMIYQELSLARHLSVMENIVLGMEPGRGPLVDWRRMRALAREAMEQLGRPDIHPETPVRELSPAQQQLVEIGRALALGSRVLVLDEPTSSLARNDCERLFELVRRLRARGLGIVYISHYLEEVRALADSYTVLRDGRSAGSGRVADIANEALIALMVGRPLEELYPRSSRTPGAPVLELDALAGASKPAHASLKLHRGEILGIAGIVGAGRTELLRTVFGLDPVRAGSVRLGAVSGPFSPGESWRNGMGMVSEDRKSEGLALSRGIGENLALSSLKGWVRPAQVERVGRGWIERLGIRCAGPVQAVGELSGGNQQKVAIGRLLEHGVDVLLLDEPTRGIDVGSKASIYKLLDELACAGRAVLLVSSYLPELLGVCDRIAVMNRGRLGPARPVSEWDPHQIMTAAIESNEPNTHAA